MYFTGTGTGKVTYQINDESAVNAKQCSVVVLEDDCVSTLVLQVVFQDVTHGNVQVGITETSYSPATTQYQDIASLTILFQTCTPQGGWASEAGSTVELFVTRQTTNEGFTYSGTFSAEDLVWVGSGTQNSLTIKLSSFSFPATSSSEAIDRGSF